MSAFLHALTYWGPTPLWPDPGHRLYAVTDEKAAASIVRVLEANGLMAWQAFDAGPTHQVVMRDKRTVIAWFDAEFPTNFPRNGMSLVVDDPERSAFQATDELRYREYEANVHAFPVGKETLYGVTSSALIDNSLIFRKHWAAMGKPAMRPIPR